MPCGLVEAHYGPDVHMEARRNNPSITTVLVFLVYVEVGLHASWKGVFYSVHLDNVDATKKKADTLDKGRRAFPPQVTRPPAFLSLADPSPPC
jgi:hypothetical protein